MKPVQLLFNRRLVAMVIGLVIVAGMTAIETLPRQEDPRFIGRNATVLTPYPGAEPSRVEALVTKPLEDAIRTIAEVETLQSTSRQGLSVVSIELADDVTDVAPIWSRIRDRIADTQAALPAGSQRPLLVDDRSYAFTAVVAIGWTLNTPANPLILGRYADLLEDRFRSLPGTDYTNRFGASREVVEVVLDPPSVAGLGLSPDTIARGLEAADARRGGGELTGGSMRGSVELAGDFESLDRLRDVGITTRQGQTVRLADISELRRGLLEPAEQYAMLDGGTVVMVGARMGAGQRVDRWMERARAMLDDFEDSLPAGLEATLVFEQAGYTSERLNQVVGSLFAGLAIVVALLFLTLGWRGAITVGLAIPATALLTLALFPLAGLEIHQMSVTGIIVALGLMVDNAIVVTNALRQRLADGNSLFAATSMTLRRLAIPLLASTLTTILAFMPIVLLPGGAGEFVGPLAMAVIVALASSYLVALLLVPALTQLFPQPTVRENGQSWVADAFRRLIGAGLKVPAVTLAAAFSLPVIGIAMMPTIPVAFFPPADRDQFHLELRLNATADIHQTRAAAERAAAVIREFEGVRHTWFVVGSNAPMVYYNQIPTDDGNPAFAHGIVDTESQAATKRIVPELQRRLDAALPDAQIIVRKYEQGPPFEAPLELRVYGNELTTLADLGDRIALLMRQLPQVTHVRSLVTQDATKLVAALDEELLRESGLDPALVSAQLGAALSGLDGGFLLEETEQLPVQVRYPAAWRDHGEALGDLLLMGTAGGDGIPLASVATLGMEPAWSSIQRRNGERVQVIRGYLEADTLPAIAMAELERLLEDALILPPGYRLETGGEAAERDEAVTRLLGSVLMLVTLMIAVVTLTFNSFRRAAIVFAAGAQALGMGLLALYLTGHAFGFVIIVGVMGLVGVAINATIILIAALDENPRARAGDPDAMAAVITGTTSRHILSTTITTVGGLSPLMFVAGDFWPPFAQTVGGGLLLATVIAFMATPAAYRLLVARPTVRGRVPDDGHPADENRRQLA